MTDAAPPDAIPAATLVILRDRPAGPPDILMIERAAAMAFAAGAMVFPGGRVDPGDVALAAPFGLDDGAARIAAIRETLEETGLAIGFARPAATVAAMRAALLRGAPFAAVLAGQGVELDLGALTPFTRWRPDRPRTRNFDARFYLAAASVGEASADGGETVSLGWASAAEWLARDDRGAAQLIFPTRRTLERLAQFADLAAARADAAAHPVTTITPRAETRDGVAGLRIPEGLGYPITFVPLDRAVRG